MQAAVIKAPTSNALAAARDVVELLGNSKKLKAGIDDLEKATGEYRKAAASSAKEAAAVEHAREAIEAENAALAKLANKLHRKENDQRARAAAFTKERRRLAKMESELVELDANVRSNCHDLELYKKQLQKRTTELDTREALLSKQRQELVRKAERIIAIAGE